MRWRLPALKMPISGQSDGHSEAGNAQTDPASTLPPSMLLRWFAPAWFRYCGLAVPIFHNAPVRYQPPPPSVFAPAPVRRLPVGQLVLPVMRVALGLAKAGEAEPERRDGLSS